MAALILDMDSTPEGLVNVASVLLSADSDDVANVSAPFTEELFQITLNWMATGEHEKLRVLLDKLRTVIYQEDWIKQARATPVRLRLFFYLEVTGQLLATFLHTNNLARYLGVISGVRRQSWRKAMESLLESESPCARQWFVDANVFANDKTAFAALKQLVQVGLVGSSRKGGRVLYELTWQGRAIARQLTQGDAAAGVPSGMGSSLAQEAEGAAAPSRQNVVVPFRRPRSRSRPYAQEVPTDDELWLNSPTCQFAIKNGVRELTGDYLLTAQYGLDGPGRASLSDATVQHGRPAFYAHWQEQIKTDILNVLSRIAQKQGYGTARHNRLQPQTHNYPYIESEIRRGRLALPWEMLFGVHERADRIGIVRLAFVTSYRAVYVKDSVAARSLRWAEDKEVSAIPDRLREGGVRVCALANTAAEGYVWDAVTSWNLGASQSAESEGGVKGLLRWLTDLCGEGVVICDTGIAYALMDLAHGSRLKGKLAMVKGRYPEPIPVGIGYAHNDETWGRLVAAMVAQSLRSSDPAITRSWEITRHVCSALDMEWGTGAPKLGASQRDSHERQHA